MAIDLPNAHALPTASLCEAIQSSGSTESGYNSHTPPIPVAWFDSDVYPIEGILTWIDDQKTDDAHAGEALIKFATKVAGNSIRLDPEFAQVIEERFWDLL